jgi:hypothetical protein
MPLVWLHMKRVYTGAPEFTPWEVIRIRKSHRRHNGQKKRNKRTNNDLQNITQKTNGRVTWFSRGELRCSGIYSLHMQPYQRHKWKTKLFTFMNLSFYSFSFGHCVVCVIYGFGLPLWYLQTLLGSDLYLSPRFKVGNYLCSQIEYQYSNTIKQWPPLLMK